MKGLLLAGVLLIFLAGGYYFRSSFFQTAIDRGLYQSHYSAVILTNFTASRR